MVLTAPKLWNSMFMLYSTASATPRLTSSVPFSFMKTAPAMAKFITADPRAPVSMPRLPPILSTSGPTNSRPRA